MGRDVMRCERMIEGCHDELDDTLSQIRRSSPYLVGSLSSLSMYNRKHERIVLCQPRPMREPPPTASNSRPFHPPFPPPLSTSSQSRPRTSACHVPGELDPAETTSHRPHPHRSNCLCILHAQRLLARHPSSFLPPHTPYSTCTVVLFQCALHSVLAFKDRLRSQM